MSPADPFAVLGLKLSRRQLAEINQAADEVLRQIGPDLDRVAEAVAAANEVDLNVALDPEATQSLTLMYTFLRLGPSDPPTKMWFALTVADLVLRLAQSFEPPQPHSDPSAPGG